MVISTVTCGSRQQIVIPYHQYTHNYECSLSFYLTETLKSLILMTALNKDRKHNSSFESHGFNPFSTSNNSIMAVYLLSIHLSPCTWDFAPRVIMTDHIWLTHLVSVGRFSQTPFVLTRSVEMASSSCPDETRLVDVGHSRVATTVANVHGELSRACIPGGCRLAFIAI